jgi:hypothetical protein
MHGTNDDGFIETLVGDGRSLFVLTGLCLIFSGGFAVFQSITGHFLPHDVEFLGMTAVELCALKGCRIVHFMFHDRVAFGGAIFAVGTFYLWLAEFPLRRGEAWSWWLLALTGGMGFGSFLAYLGYGYLDSWHGVATLLLLPVFVWGLLRTRALLPQRSSPQTLLVPGIPLDWRSASGLGRICLLGAGVGMILAGATILAVGVTRVFVAQDLEFMHATAADLNAINPRLIPLIAHDRAGFGGGIFTCGILVLASAWCARPSRSLRQVMAIAGTAGFACALGVHFVVGYTDFVHLLPAYAGAMLFLVGVALSRRF